jgi:hypothetical protein
MIKKYEEQQEKIKRLITEGEDLQRQLLPLWSRYRRWAFEIKMGLRFSSPPREQLVTPDVQYLLDGLSERLLQLERSELYGQTLEPRKENLKDNTELIQ